MINRSKVKYSLKKVLPAKVFTLILFLWRTLLLKIVEMIDTVRLKGFTIYHPTALTHKGKTFTLFLSPDNGFIDKHIFLYGVYEPFMLDLINENLKEGDTFVDIGANIGQHSMFAASIVQEIGSVYSFEPIPRIYAQFMDSVHANHFDTIIHAQNVAIGTNNSKQDLYIKAENIGGSSLVDDDGATETIDISIRHGDVLLSHIPHITMVKIDVEGYEYEVLSGIQETIKKHAPIILIEFSGYFYNEQQQNHGQKILSLLENLGYRMYDIENDMKLLDSHKNFIASFTDTRKQTNLLCKAEIRL
jgi:FkbM family methyltransferase